MTQFTLSDTRSPEHITKDSIAGELKAIQSQLFELQNLFYANQDRSLLIILQGLDAAGKDSTIKHVFSCVNPMGCNVKSFQKPTAEERRHGFLWRIYPHLPAKGMIQIFNRSHYEDILVPTVHGTLAEHEIEPRYDYINAFEEHLERNGTIILKFFLNISEAARDKKLARRRSDPRRKWKYDSADDTERKNRSAYLEVYSRLFEECSPAIPWHLVPADQKWFRNYLIAQTVVNRLKALDMEYPA